ncbi:MAG TPA: UbiA family prenyltransferase [Caulobacteraceae bacterium]|nr:UbiA family prenyltransferase [Caulobacteraceae bacterium]
MTTVLPDAAPANWVDRYAPRSLRPWLKLGRFDRPTGIWLLMLPGWQGIALADAMDGRTPDLRLLALFFVGAALMRAAGCAYNDIVDRDIDAKVARTARRPVASGQISVRAAWAFVVGCSLASLLILLDFNLLAVVLGVASLGLVAFYPFMKRITWWPQAWLGLTFNWGALLGFAAASGGLQLGLLVLDPRAAAHIDLPMTRPEELRYWIGHLSLPAVLLYASGVFWTLGYDTIYAVQDLEDDALVGVKSSARRLGERAPGAVFAFYLVALALAALVGLTADLGWVFWPFFGLYALALLVQPHRLKLDDPARALTLFKMNSRAGLLLFLALTVGYWRG